MTEPEKSSFRRSKVGEQCTTTEIAKRMLADRFPERIAALLLVDAGIPSDGKSVLDGYPAAQRQSILSRVLRADNADVLPPRSAADLGLLGIEGAEGFDLKTRPWSIATLTDPVSLNGAWTLVADKRAIIAARGPRGSEGARASYRAKAAAHGLRSEVWDCGHWVMMEQAERLAAVIRDMAGACR